MVPYLLLLLFSFSLVAPTRICNERTACLYFTTCYDETKLDSNSARMHPDLSIWVSLADAVERKHNCSTFGVISALSIEPISSSTCNFSFETDLNNIGFAFGNDTQKMLEFKANDNTTVNLNGNSQTLDVTKFLPKDGESHGNAIYSFQLQHNADEMTNPSWMTCHLSVGDVKTEANVNEFWEILKTKVPCDVKIVHDLCKDNSERCDKALITGHSVSCEDPSQLTAKVTRRNDWNGISSVSCTNQQWTTNDGSIYQSEFDVLCSKPASTTTTASTTTSTTDAVTTRTIRGKGPVAVHQEAPLTTIQPEHGKEGKKDEGGNGGKWLWIGLGAALFIIIIIVNLIVCLICFKKKNSTAKKLSKTQQPTNRNTKKKGVKGPEDSTTGVPSSSELIVEPSKASKESLNPQASGSAEKNVQPTSEPAATEMGLDLLKTEKLN